MDPFSILMMLAGGGTVAGGLANAFGSWMGADAQRDAANRAMGLQREIYGQQRADQSPYLQAGQSSLADLLRQMQAGAFDVDGSTLQNDPGYQFRLAEGQRALERSAAARGGLNSGGTLRSLARYSQGVASDELQNAWQRRQGAFGRLASIAGMGQNAANSLGQFGSNYANSMSSLYGAQGNAEAARWTGLGNALADISGGASQMGMAATGGMMPQGSFAPTASAMGSQGVTAQPLQFGQQQLPTQSGGYGYGRG